MKRVWALVLVLAMVAVACGGGDEADDTTATEATTTEATEGTDAAQGGDGGTLQAVIDRGRLLCGVSTVAVGFAEPQDDGSFTGFDADYCRALAAAIFGDASAVEFRGTTAAERLRMERGLSFLATVGANAPFIGLFGTVWGIMNSFQAIAMSRDTNLAVVAPGIAEALFATGLGLLAAIPAVVAYNACAASVQRFASRLDHFADDFINLMARQSTPQSKG